MDHQAALPSRVPVQNGGQSAVKYDQIVTHLQTEIANKRLLSGDKAPSIRETAARFNCSKATVIRAYSELEAKHILFSVPQSGYFVVNSRQISSSGLSDIDFASMRPDAAIIPYLQFRHCINQALDVYQEQSFMYTDRQGLPDLRAALAKQLQDYQIFEKSQNIYITAGAQQTIDILVRMPFPNGKLAVLVEQPTYSGILKSLKNAGVTAVGITRNYTGIDFNKLENYFKNGNIKFFYTIPRYHNPTGTSYSRAEKQMLVDLARKYDVYIVEDDYLAEFNFDSKADPLYAMDDSHHVLYIKSYSKVFLPGLRLGAILLPPAFRNVFLDYKGCVDPYASSILQGALTMFLTNGMYTHHAKDINNFYRNRIIALEQACRRLPSAITWRHLANCAFVFLELPDTINFARLSSGLQAKNVLIQGGDLWYLPGFSNNSGLRVCVYQTSEVQITAGMAVIADEVDYWLKRTALGPSGLSDEV